MDNFTKYVTVLGITAAVIIGAIAYMSINYNYRWLQQCAVTNGVQMENMSGARVCVRGPVEIITIAARPW